jgi:hypothetical protein
MRRPVSPHDHNQSPQPTAVRAVPGGAHDGDDLFNLRRIGRVTQTFVAGRVTGMEARHRRRRPTSTGTVEQQLGHDPSSGSWNEPDYPPTRRTADPSPIGPRYRFRQRAAVKHDPRQLSRLPRYSSAVTHAPANAVATIGRPLCEGATTRQHWPDLS